MVLWNFINCIVLEELVTIVEIVKIEEWVIFLLTSDFSGLTFHHFGVLGSMRQLHRFVRSSEVGSLGDPNRFRESFARA